MLVRDLQLANAVAVGMRSLVAEAGGDMPVLVPPMYGDEFAGPGAARRLRAWWDEQRTGVELSAAALLIVDVEELAGLGRVAYVAVPPGQTKARSLSRRGAVIEVPATTVRELVDAVVAGTVGAGGRSQPSRAGQSAFSMPRPEWHAKPLWDRQLVRKAVLTGALGFGAWLLPAAFAPGQAQAATVQQQQLQQQQQHPELQQYQQQQQRYQQPVSDAVSAQRAEADFSRSGQSSFEQEVRERITERLRAAGVDEEALRQIQRGLQAPGLADQGRAEPADPAHEAMREAPEVADANSSAAQNAHHAARVAAERAQIAADQAPRPGSDRAELGEQEARAEGNAQHNAVPGTQDPSLDPAADRAAGPRTLPAPVSQDSDDSSDSGDSDQDSDTDDASEDSGVPTADLPGLAEHSTDDDADEDSEDNAVDEADSAAGIPLSGVPSAEGTDSDAEAPRDQPYGGPGTVQAPEDDRSGTPLAVPDSSSPGAPPATAAPGPEAGQDVPADRPAPPPEAQGEAPPAPVGEAPASSASAAPAPEGDPAAAPAPPPVPGPDGAAPAPESAAPAPGAPASEGGAPAPPGSSPSELARAEEPRAEQPEAPPVPPPAEFNWGDFAGRTFDGAYTGFVMTDQLVETVGGFRDPENARPLPEPEGNDAAKTASKGASRWVAPVAGAVGGLWNASEYVGSTLSPEERESIAEWNKDGPMMESQEPPAPADTPPTYVPGPVNNGWAGSLPFAELWNQAPPPAAGPGSSPSELARAEEAQAPPPAPPGAPAPPPGAPAPPEGGAPAPAPAPPAPPAPEVEAPAPRAPEGEAPAPPAPEGEAPAPPAPEGEAPAPPAPEGEASAPPAPPAPEGEAPAPPAPEGEAPAPSAPEEELPAPPAPEEEAPAPEAPEEEAPAPEAPEGEAPAPPAPEEEVPAPPAPEEEAPAPESPEEEAPAPEAPEGEAPAPEAPEAPAPEAPAPPPAPPAG